MQFLLRIPCPDGEVDVLEGGLEVSRPEEARGAVGEGERQRGRRVPPDEVVPFFGSDAIILRFANPF